MNLSFYYLEFKIIIMKKIIAAGLLSALLTTGAFADINGSYEIKDENGNTIWNTRSLDMISTTSIQERNVLTENELNFIDHAYESLSSDDVELMWKLHNQVNDYVYFKSNTQKKRILDDLVVGLEQEVFKLVMKYPADTSMSKSDTRLYLMMNALKLELHAKSW